MDSSVLLRSLLGKLGQKSELTVHGGQRVDTWDLKIEGIDYLDDYGLLRSGYSGSPVIDINGNVLGIVAIQIDRKGEVGLAISINAVSRIWTENIPTALVSSIISNPHDNSSNLQSINTVNTRSQSVSPQINFSGILVDLNKKFKEAPENITDPQWNLWFREMFELQHSALTHISFQIGSLLDAHRTTVYFLTEPDEATDSPPELWSIVAQGDLSSEIRVPFGEGVSGQVAVTKQIISIPFDAYEKADDAKEIKAQDERTGYRTYSMLTVPLLNEDRELIAVFQFLNKLKYQSSSTFTFDPTGKVEKKDIDIQGFSPDDQKKFEQYIPEIQLTLDLYQSYYQQFNKLQSIVNFSSATLNLNKKNQSLEELLRNVIDEAQKITNADRGTFWLLDRKGETLQAEILDQDNNWRKIYVRVGQGFAGKVAKTQQTLNIPFDLYNHPQSGKSQETDKKTGYRTCSLLCMPVFDTNKKLIGVTQLLNKRRNQSQYKDYNNYEGTAPPHFRANFLSEDEKRLKKFNEQVASAIESARQPLINEQYDHSFQLLSATAQLSGGFLNAHTARIYFVDTDVDELWSVVAKPETGEPFEISLPIGVEDIGIAALEADSHIIKNLIDAPTSDLYLKQFKNGIFQKYPIFNKLCLPIRKGNKLIAVIEFLNKLKPEFASVDTVEQQAIDSDGFNIDDVDYFNYEHKISTTQLIEAFIDVYRPIKKYRDSEKLRRAKETVISANSALPLEQVMTAAQELVNAHRSTLWIVDPKDTEALFANITNAKGEVNTITATIGEGYVGKAAQRAIDRLEDNVDNYLSDTKLDNIKFDLYKDEPASRKAKRTDKMTRYRTCSLLCMPIISSDGRLLGVIQLVNKIRRGYEELVLEQFPEKEAAPECFMASFSSTDEQLIRDFNAAVGYILQLIGVRKEILSGDSISTFERKLERVQNRI